MSIQGNTLTQILQKRSVLTNAGVTFIDGSNQSEFLSYKELYALALNALGYLQGLRIAPRTEVVFQIEDNKSFIIAFWACVLGGMIPIPVAIGNNDEHRRKFFNIWNLLDDPYLIGSENSLGALKEFATRNGFTDVFGYVKDGFIKKNGLTGHHRQGQVFDTVEDDIAFIQFSSGSTGTPKGVVLTHENLLTNVKAIGTMARYSTEDAMMSWMPLTHDMGLIGFHLCPVFEGMHHVIMATHLFVRNPSLWLQKADEHNASILCSPNFGYKYVLRHTNPQAINNLDLSRVRLFYNGAEPISVELCREFLSFFAKAGLKSNAMCPVYGLAEASLAVSISALEDEVISVDVDRRALHVGDRIVPLTGSVNTISLVNVGRAVPACSIRITDSSNQGVLDDVIGYVKIKGRNVTSGYYNDPTSGVIDEEGWLDTGDVGLLRNGSLYITGRAKDIIFVNGQNYYSYDIEQVAQSVDEIELNKIAVVGYFNVESQENEAIAFVFHRGDLSRFVPLANAVRSIVSNKMGLTLSRVLPVSDIPRTTSGKLQRFKLVERYTAGLFRAIESELNQWAQEAGLNATLALAPGNETEERIAAIWARVLGSTAFTPDQAFSEVGGNSLKLAEVGMLVWKEFQVELSLDVLLEKQTIRALADALLTLRKTEYQPIPKIDEEDYYPVSASQKRLYYAWRVDKQSLAYNNPSAFTIKGRVNREALEDAMNVLIQNNDALRMSFEFTSVPVFKIQERVDFTIEGIACQQDGVESYLKSFVRPFDLDKAPLCRVKILEVDAGDSILFLDFHHIVMDGLSIYTVVRDLLDVYSTGTVREKSIGYKDYARWQMQGEFSDKVALQGEFWLNHLSGKIPVLNLPYDFSRPALFTTAGKKMEFALSASTTKCLRAFAKANGCTLFVVMSALYKVLLFKYSGQKEIVVGIPVAGRNHPDLLDLYGMFVNNIALKSSISGEEQFIQFLHNHKRQVGAALENQDYPFDTLVEALGHRSDASRNPVFDTMFVYQNMGAAEFHASTITLTPFFFDPGFSRFDISMEVFESGQLLQYNIEYGTGIFKEETIQRVAHHFDQLIARVLADPTCKLAALSLLSDVEYDQFIHVFNDTRMAYDHSKTIDQLVEDQVKLNPSAIAVVYDEVAITYKELNDRANQLAGLLQEKGVRADTIVGIFMKRSPALIVSMLGILKAGGAYLPLDLDIPEDRIAHILRDSKSDILMTTSDQRPGIARLNQDRARELTLTIVDFDAIDFASQPPVLAMGSRNSLRQLAYVIYTSGTTGSPKGVMIEHGSIANYIQWAANEYVDDGMGSFPLFTNIAFDLTITSIWVPLATGNSIIVFEDKQALALMQVLESDRVNVIKLTPSHLRILKEVSTDTFVGKNLRKFIVGGEALDTALAREIYDKFQGSVDIYNEYGPTEATIGCMIHTFDPEATAATVSIGKPIHNTQIYVLDEFMKPVPIGAEGELYISGDGLARGYLFKKELTDQKFIENPFIQGQRMYKTGDYARRLSSGTIEYMGRIDDQVKVRGYRVELLEIASSLKANDAIDDAIVIQKTIHHGQSVLIAYYVSERMGPDSALHEPALKRFLAGRLPDYMIPAHFARLDRFPLTENGKVDRSALPEPGLSPHYVTPGDRVEAALLEVWKEIFGSEDISVADNFFDLGGDSIKAVQIASRLFEKKVEVKARDILRYHTIEQIALQAMVIGTNVYEQGVLVGERGLTPIESWFFDRHFTNPNFYNQSVLLHFHKPIQLALVSQALRVLIEHHDSLRTNYSPERKRCFYNNAFLADGVAIQVVDLDKTSDSLETLCYQMKQHFDFTRELLLRAGILTGKAGNYLFLTAHHLVVDAFSWRVLLEDFYLIYKALEVGDSPRLPAKTASMQLWEQELTAFKQVTQSDSRYWDEVRQVEFVIPRDFDANGDHVAAPGRKVVKFDQERTMFLLTEGYKAYKTDVLTLLTTGLALTLRQWTGDNEYIVDFENHGRHLEEVDASRTVGWFTSLYPVKLTLAHDSLTDQIKSIKEQLRRVPHFGLGYGMQEPKVETASEIRFNYLGQFGGELNNNLFSYSDRFTGEEADPANGLTTKLDLNLMIIDGVLRLEVNYSSGSFKESTVDTFCGIFLDEMTRIHDHIKSEREVHFSPSDFDAVELDDDLLKSLFD